MNYTSELTATHKLFKDASHYYGARVYHDPNADYHDRRNCPYDEIFDFLFVKTVKDKLRGAAQTEYIRQGLIDEFGGVEDWDSYIADSIKRKLCNLHGRRRRFRQKAYLNDWSYFVTFTYDDLKQDEDSFRAGLKKCLSNLHTRHGWKYMGVFERSPSERLHFHCLLYVPAGEMVGDLIETTDFNFKHHTHKTAIQNTFFLGRFGRNDFEELNSYEIGYGNTINYLLKYITKSDDKVFYSRAVPSFLFCNIEKDEIQSEMVDFGLKFILADDVITDEDPDGVPDEKPDNNTLMS